MKVTGHLAQPGVVPPCPNYNDVPSVHQAPPMDMSGYDQCSTYDRNKNMKLNLVEMDNFNPEKFKYDQYRYQMFARPAHFDCGSSNMMPRTKPADPMYRPAYSDVRALEQTMYIPIVPSKPGGETDVTFPMTPRTMGQPDVTSACCVPVIPSQPGYRNLTQGILPGPCSQMNGPVGGAIPSAGGQGCPYMRQMCGAASGGGGGGGCAHCSPQIIRPPSNVLGGGTLGLPDTFPGAMQFQSGLTPTPTCSYAQQMAPISSLQLPNYTGQMASSFNPHHQNVETAYDGMPRDKMCTSASMVRYQDRVQRAIQKSLESPMQKRRRMREVYGHYGSYLLPTPYQKRHDIQIRPDLIILQGNGFQWEYPHNRNQQCYVIERNQRCS